MCWGWQDGEHHVAAIIMDKHHGWGGLCALGVDEAGGRRRETGTGTVAGGQGNAAGAAGAGAGSLLASFLGGASLGLVLDLHALK